MSLPLAVAEIFGPTIQGEGPSAGQYCTFLRLGGCNLQCSWCDTPYTWDWTGRNGKRYEVKSELTMCTLDDVMAWLYDVQEAPGHLVVTGGEPLLQQRRLWPLVDALLQDGWAIEVETNGTITPQRSQDNLFFNVSPKLASSGNALTKRRIVPALEWFAKEPRAIFKFVVTKDHYTDDLDEVAFLVSAQGLSLDPSRVWLMPEGTTPDAIIAGARILAKDVLDRGYNLSFRQHVLLWGNDRGR